MKGKRDSSMVTAPRDKWVMLERFPDGDGGPKRFVGRWNEEKFRWEDQDGVFRSRVHSWHPLPANSYKPGEIVTEERVMKAVQSMIDQSNAENAEFEISCPRVIRIFETNTEHRTQNT